MLLKKRITCFLCLSLSLFLLSVFSAGASPVREKQKKLAAELLSATGNRGGLVVHISCGKQHSLGFTIALHADGKFLVQALYADRNRVQPARETLQALGLSGPVSVAGFNGTLLPYTGNLVDLLVVSSNPGIAEAELMRVLAPNGVLFEKQSGEWKKTVKPWPPEIDTWTHYLHGPDNNAVADDRRAGPPRHMQWVAQPVWTRNHHKLNSVSAVVTAGGRLFSVVDRAPAANINLPGDWHLVARNAFNGLLLWEKRLDSWAWHAIRFRSGPPQLPRLLVTSGGHVFLPLGLNRPVSMLDAESGGTIKTFGATVGAEELVLTGDTLLVVKGAPVAEHGTKHEEFKSQFLFPNNKEVLAVHLKTGGLLWKWSSADDRLLPETLCSDGERVFFQTQTGVTCLDKKNGASLWSYTAGGGKAVRKRLTFGTYTVVVKDGVVLCNLFGELTALSAENGKKLWSTKAGGGFHSPLDVFVIKGCVWQGLHVSDSVAPSPVDDFDLCRDLFTGEARHHNSIMVDLQTAGHHHRCYREKATTRYIMTGKRGIELMDLEGDNHSRNNWIRGTCQYGIMPANGFIYAPPHSCGCYMESKLRGFWALSAEKSVVSDPGRRPDTTRRILYGPAYAESDEGREAAKKKDRLPVRGRTDWPFYRHDHLRSGVSATEVPSSLKCAWKTPVSGRLTQPVISNGKVLVASVDQNTVYALDAKTGKAAWKYTADGRIDSPPALYGDKVFFGSASGKVYGLGLSDGKLLWCFLAAPADIRAVAYDQVESLWPVHGSVLIFNGVLYCSAGRSSWLDDGIYLYALDPATGEVLARSHCRSGHPVLGEGKEHAEGAKRKRIAQNVVDYKTSHESDRSDSFSMAGGVVSDVLVSDGYGVFLHHAAFTTGLKPQQKFSRHLFSTSSLLDDAENHRSHWVLGTGDFSEVPVAYSWVVNNPRRWTPTIAVPTGVHMLFNDEAVWGVRRKGDANGRYYLFKRANTPFSENGPGLPDFRRLPKNRIESYLWSRDLAVRPHAMVKAGAYLFLGVMPVSIPEDDPYAAYAGEKGGGVWVVSASDGTTVAEYSLPSPVIWDGLAAADERLYGTTYAGEVFCLSGNKSARKDRQKEN